MNIYETIKENSSDVQNIREQFKILIKDEQEAIAGYKKALSTLHLYLNDEEINKCTEVFNHIIEEETEHIEELESLFKEIKPTE